MSTALVDYRCPLWPDLHRLVDVKFEMAKGAKACAPVCPICLLSGSAVTMEPIPAIGRMDIGGNKGVAFQSFQTFDGQNRPVFVDSVHKLRQVEKQSEIDHKNGEGQPLNFRVWSNDKSNKDAPALHRSFYGGDAPDPAAAKKFGNPTKSTSAPDTSYGPGVTDKNTSALGE